MPGRARLLLIIVCLCCLGVEGGDYQYTALKAIYEGLGGHGWKHADGWDRYLIDFDYCKPWYGITCDGAKNVVGLNLAGNGLSGKQMPETMSLLSSLVKLDLSNNAIAGELPLALGGSMLQLTQLVLANNSLTGSIPSAYVALESLSYLDVSGNQLTGDIEPNFGGLPLAYVDIADNDFSGTLPTWLACPTHSLTCNAAGNPLLECPTACSGNQCHIRSCDCAWPCTTHADCAGNARGCLWCQPSHVCGATVSSPPPPFPPSPPSPPGPPVHPRPPPPALPHPASPTSHADLFVGLGVGAVITLLCLVLVLVYVRLRRTNLRGYTSIGAPRPLAINRGVSPVAFVETLVADTAVSPVPDDTGDATRRPTSAPPATDAAARTTAASDGPATAPDSPDPLHSMRSAIRERATDLNTRYNTENYYAPPRKRKIRSDAPPRTVSFNHLVDVKVLTPPVSPAKTPAQHEHPPQLDGSSEQ